MIVLSNCATARLIQRERRYDFTLKNTLSIFMLNNENGAFLCIPVQYMGDYQIQSFEFKNGNISIGGCEILLNMENVNIAIYLNESADESGGSTGMFNLIHSQENGRTLRSKINEPLVAKDPGSVINHYYIFIERFINESEMDEIISEYEKGNIYSRMGIEYDLAIDNEEQFGSGIYDDFELYDGIAMDPAWFPPNLNFFKIKYME